MSQPIEKTETYTTVANEPDAPQLTRREYYAAQAMAGLCACGIYESDFGTRMAARLAVEVADELIRALGEGGE